MILNKKSPLVQSSLIALSAYFTQSAHAASFTLTSGTTTTTQQVLNSDNDVGLIETEATLNVTGNNAVVMNAASNILTNSGAISNSGNFTGVHSDSANAIIINSGTISTTGLSAHGIGFYQENATLTNSGAVSTSGNNSYGIFSTVTGLTITNSGTISTIGNSAFAINSSAANATITNSGTISTAGSASHGVRSSGADAIITNSGIVSATGGSSNGIFSSGADVLITNSGTISTDDNLSDAVHSNEVGATITNSGTIFTGGDDSDAISVYGANAAVTNSGTISTVSYRSLGIRSGGEGAIITNSSIISTTGNASHGVRSNGASSTIVNSVIISTAGNTSHGVRSSGADALITNSGTISTAGSSSHGISSYNTNATITNSGTINVSGSNSSAVNLHSTGSSNNTLTNSGKITVSGDATQAILGGTGEQTVILQKGSQIIGTIDLGAGTDNLTITGNGISSRIQTTNIENLSIGANVAGVVVGNDLHAVDPTGAAMLTIGVNKLSLNIHDVINSHNNSETSNKSPIWATAFNSNFDRGADAGNLAYKNRSTGFVGGYGLDSKNSKGLIFGVSESDLDTKDASFKTDVTSFFFGGYQNINLTQVTSLKFDLIAGYERYESKRTVVDNINGYQTATSNFNNLFISPSATLEHKFKIDETFELDPFARLSYTASIFDEGRETGTTASNIKTNSRQTQIFNSRVGVNAIMNVKGGQLEVGTGFDNRVIKEGKVNASIDGNKFKYNTNNDNNVNGHYVRLGAKIPNFRGVSINLSFEKRSADGNENESFGQLGAIYKF